MDLIDRQALVKIFRRTSVLDMFPEWKTMNPSVKAAITRLCRKYREIILDAPTVDAVPVVHGRWEWIPTDECISVLTCSVCKKAGGASVFNNYCPNCGAKMDGGAEDGNL